MNILKNIFLVVAGTLILALGTALFIIPFELVAGGVSGMAIIINKIIPFKALTVDGIVTILTWGLFFVGLLFLGKQFAIKTLISSLIYPIGISVFLRLVSPDVLNGFFYLPGNNFSEVSIILASIFGGVFVGTGCALTFLGGGSTGGVDIIAFIICKFFKKAKTSVVMFFIDAITVISGMFVIKNIVISLLGITSAFISAAVIDKIFLGESKAFVAHIVSDKYKELNEKVIEKLKRTTTILDATGGYSGENKKMIMVSFTMTEYAEMVNIINKVDKNAFITIHRAHEINGEGWTR